MGWLDNLLSGGSGALLGAGAAGAAYKDISNRLGGVGTKSREGALAVGEQARADTQFQPFTVSTGFGGLTTQADGSTATALSPEMAAQQQQLQGISGGLMGGFQPPQALADPTGISQGAYGQAQGALGGPAAGQQGIDALSAMALGQAPSMFQGAMGSMAGREADVYDRIRATQAPEEQRRQLALDEQLASQGRTGLRTAMFGGSPEQFAMEKARAEAMNQASLAAIGQAGTEQERQFGQAQMLSQLGLGAAQAGQGLQQGQLGLASGMFGLGSQAQQLPYQLQGLQQGLAGQQLGNIGQAMGLQYMPEQQLLASLTPGLEVAGMADVARRQGAGLFGEAGITGIESQLAAEMKAAEVIGGGYSSALAGIFNNARPRD